MDFLNLSFGEFAALAGVLSVAVFALYLMDRSKKRQMVATLRFWKAGKTPEELEHKRRIHQPWSLLLQLLGILLLLAAIAEPFLGNRSAMRDHVLVLDTSAWMGARARQGTLLDQAKTAALAYVDSVPAADRIMLVRADALPTPVTQFEANHTAVSNAIRRSQPSTSALNLEPALEFAERSQRLQGHLQGEIVFAGAGRVSREDAELIEPPTNLRMLSIPANGENVGIRKLGLRRASDISAPVIAAPLPMSAAPANPLPLKSPKSNNTWEIFVGLRNDGARPREVKLDLQFGAAPIGSKTLTIAAGAETQEVFRFEAKTAGVVEARVESTNGRGDSFPQDDRAAVDLPAPKFLRIAAFTTEPDLLKPLLSDEEHLSATYFSPSQYTPRPQADLVILDRFTPKDLPQIPAVWIEPQPGSPFVIRNSAAKAKLERWLSDSPLTAGLNSRDVQLTNAEILTPVTGDQAIAQSSEGALILARNTPQKTVALGFHPLRSSMKYDLATPLLVANILRWMAPETFRRSDVQAGNVGMVTVPIEKDSQAANIRVLDSNQRPLPFSIQDSQLRFFSGTPGDVRVIVGERETLYSLTLPDIGDITWNPPSKVARGIPRTTLATTTPPSLWPWLAAFGGLALLTDWLLFGRKRMVRLKARPAASTAQTFPWRKAS